ncbi:lipid-A-disaccharide synthase-related protein [Pannus brasiliensis CCIBt3594]|uniref:Lipid-A-disaccharide synthase-related protein n=1 Tax=Pannus brasiliensis CCIBt3594 TaxID=1427578 RepID=A0AAW9QUC1_9CHRO
MSKRVLFLSNGHGEDLNASLILRELIDRNPDVSISAMPLVGEGNAYRRLGVPIIGPTSNLPSGGIIYTDPMNCARDILAGLIGLTVRQVRSILRSGQDYDLLIAVGDIFPITVAWLTGRPFIAFIVSTSSYYEGRLRLPALTEFCLGSPRCLQVFTRDRFTAEDLQSRGMKKAIHAGYPIMDAIAPTGKDLGLDSRVPTIALLPGSRLPEALHNLSLELAICREIAKIQPMQFIAAIVSGITETELEKLARQRGWEYLGEGKLRGDSAIVHCHRDAFADILHRCDVAIGMAGTAVEQAVGLGKPVIQIPGRGPQFTYPFAEAQMRLLGESVITVGKKPTEPELFATAARKVVEILQDSDRSRICRENGRERVGLAGGSRAIAEKIDRFLHDRG